MLKRFIHYYKPHKKLFITDMLASLLIAAIGVAYPIITRTMIKTLGAEEFTIKFILIFGGTLLGLYVLRMLLNYTVLRTLYGRADAGGNAYGLIQKTRKTSVFFL